MRVLLLATVVAATLARPAAAQGPVCPVTAADSTRALELQALRGELRAAIRAASPGDSAGYLVLEVDSASGRGRVIFVDLHLSDSLRAALISRVGETAAPQGWWFRVAPRAAEAPGELCPRAIDEQPDLTNRDRVFSRLDDLTRAYRRRDGPRVQAPGVGLKMLINAQGIPILVLLEELSGDAWLDRRLGEVARSMRFRPARTGAQSVDVWMSFTLSLNPS